MSCHGQIRPITLQRCVVTTLSSMCDRRRYDSCGMEYYSAESDFETFSQATDESSLQESDTTEEYGYDSPAHISEVKSLYVKSDSDILVINSGLRLRSKKAMGGFASDQENIPPKAFRKRLKKKCERRKFEFFPDNRNADLSSEDEFDVFDPSDKVFRKKTPASTIKLYPEKIGNITKALSNRPVNIEVLQEAATTKGGLVTDELRRRAWPRLLRMKDLEHRRRRNDAEIETHRYHNQVVLDVMRVLQRFPPGISDRQRVLLEKQLTHLIVSVLLDLPQAHYYQGYHDVAITLLLVLGPELAFHVLKRLSTTHLTEFMGPTMEPTQYLLNLVPCILRRMHTDLYDHLENASLGTIFCLPWVITWFGHEIREYDTLLQIYDYFMASPPVAPFYVAAAFVAFHARDLQNTECDMAMLHHKLSKMPAMEVNWDVILSSATDIRRKYPKEQAMKDVAGYVENKRLNEEEYMKEVKRRAESHRLALQKRKMMSQKKGSKRHMMEFVIISVGVAVAASLYAFVKNDIILL